MQYQHQHLASSPFLPGWRVSLTPRRRRVYPHGNIVSEKAERHQELKKRLKKGEKRKSIVDVYDNGLLTPWQKKLAVLVNRGCNVVVGSVTSTGKTWAANLITAHEILERDTATGLIISPNSEVMRDTVRDLETWHKKTYLYSRTMISTRTRNFQNYDVTRNGPPGQLMVISVENVIEFLTDPINEVFINNLKIIVFDEVHLTSVSQALWWSQFIPHHAQLILLSATLGDPQQAKKIVNSMQRGHGIRRETHILTCDVRPIPLQMTMFRGCELPTDGVNSRMLKKTKRLSCAINPNDPTKRDLQSILGAKADIPVEREQQFIFGQNIMSNPEYKESVAAKNAKSLENCVTDNDPKTIYTLLCYLFANEMQPVMVFNTTSEQTKNMAEKLLAYIAEIEAGDKEYRQAKKLLDNYLTAKKRSRDNDVKKRKSRNQNDWGQPDEFECEQVSNGINMHQVEHIMQKWRFPCDYKLDETLNAEQWIIDCLSYGIGVYVDTMSTHLKHHIFDAVRDGKLRVLFSDSSISVGINLPIRTVVLCGVIPYHLYKQAGGRAGRRGLDDRGYIVHLMPKTMIQQYLNQKQTNVDLVLPTYMSYTDLIRLCIPSNLLNAIEPEIERVKGKRRDYRKEQENWERVFDPKQAADDVPEYCQEILESYLETLPLAEQKNCQHQIQIINQEQWNYHRLTNFIKTIPGDTGILFVKLMASGDLPKLEVKEFIDLVALLMFRETVTDDSNLDEYYLPDFSESAIPDLIQKLQDWCCHYNLQIDLTVPIHHYIRSFCYRGVHYLKYMDQLSELGTWLYTFKTGITRCAPQQRDYIDPVHKLIQKADELFLSACSRKKQTI